MSGLAILVATDQWFPDFAGGSARIAAESARELAGRGHRLTVLAPARPGLSREEVEAGVRILRVLPRGPLPQTVTDLLAVARQARKLEQHFDLAVAHQPTVASGLVLARVGAPIVMVYHASAAREARLRAAALPFMSGGLSATLLAPVLSALERFALRRATRILTLSAYSRSLVLEDDHVQASKVFTVPPGVDVEAFADGGERAAARRRLGIADVPLVVAVRRLEPCLGVETVLEAFAQLARPADAQLALVGSGSLEGKLRRLSRALGVEERVRFVGRPPARELRDWYAAADVCVVPPAPHEGFGLAAVEALASGTPVVGAPTGATPDLLRELDPRLVAAGADARSLADVIEEALSRADQHFRSRSRAHVHERFNWSAVGGAWEEVMLGVAPTAPREHPLVSPRRRPSR